MYIYREEYPDLKNKIMDYMKESATLEEEILKKVKAYDLYVEARNNLKKILNTAKRQGLTISVTIAGEDSKHEKNYEELVEDLDNESDIMYWHNWYDISFHKKNIKSYIFEVESKHERFAYLEIRINDKEYIPNELIQLLKNMKGIKYKGEEI